MCNPSKMQLWCLAPGKMNTGLERIVEGLTPIQTCWFFQAPPSSFLQLEKLAMVDRNIAYADQ